MYEYIHATQLIQTLLKRDPFAMGGFIYYGIFGTSNFNDKCISDSGTMAFLRQRHFVDNGVSGPMEWKKVQKITFLRSRTLYLIDVSFIYYNR